MKTQLIKRFFNKFFWAQHPEASLRYIPIIKEIKKAKLLNSRILEVGSGSLGILPYLNKSFDAVDIDFRGVQSDLVNKISAKATELPFRKNSYDVVICADVLEHIEKENREIAVYEMLRVAKKLAVIVVPCGELAQKQDQDLQKRWNKTFKNQNLFLDEHVKHGLPKTNEILIYVDRSLRKLDKTAKVESYPNLNLNVRKFLMNMYISKNKLKYYFYLKGLLLAVPILRYLNLGQTYRRVFVIEFAK